MLLKKKWKQPGRQQKQQNRLLVIGTGSKPLVSRQTSSQRWSLTVHLPPPFRTDVCMCWTRLQRRLQTCYIRFPAVWIKMHISVRKHLACSRLQEEFRSLLCAPLKDGTSPSKQAPQSDIERLWWDLLCLFVFSPNHDEGSDGTSVIQDFSVLNISSFWGKLTFKNNISRHIFQYNVQKRSCSTCLHSSTSGWPRLYCICSWQQTHVSPRPALWSSCVSLKSLISHSHPSNERPSCQHRIL